MATQGPLFPGTVASTSVLPEDDQAWVNPGNVSANDGAESVITHANFDANAISHQLVTSNYGFTIPANATIDGITVEIEKDIAAGAAVDNRVQLRNASGTLVGANKATATAWPSSPTIVSYGGAADTWTASPTEAMVNDPAFGVVVSVKATGANTDIGVDFIRVTVTYTEDVNHDISPTATGGGVATVVKTTDRPIAATATGGGSAVVTQSTDRPVSPTATGGGVLVADIVAEITTENHDISVTATGGGVAVAELATERAISVGATGGGVAAVVAATDRGVSPVATGAGVVSLSLASARYLAAVMSGGGVLTADPTTERYSSVVATGGGVVVIDVEGQNENADVSVTATGGGSAAVDIATARAVALVATGGGVAVASLTTQRLLSLIATGGGVATITTLAPVPALPDIAVVTPVVDIILTPFPVAISLAAAQSLGIEVDPL